MAAPHYSASMAGTADQITPFEQERETNRFLTQETRFTVLQFILGHPKHLPSRKELNHVIPQKAQSTINEALATLVDRGIVAEYSHEQNRETRGLPVIFYGLTEDGIETLETFNLLRGLPAMMALYEKFDLPEPIRRHQAAPRPELPPTVESTLMIEDS